MKLFNKSLCAIVVKRIINAFSARVKLYHTLIISTLCYVIMIKQRGSKKHEEEKPCDMVIISETLDAHSHQRDFVC